MRYKYYKSHSYLLQRQLLNPVTSIGLIVFLPEYVLDSALHTSRPQEYLNSGPATVEPIVARYGSCVVARLSEAWPAVL